MHSPQPSLPIPVCLRCRASLRIGSEVAHWNLWPRDGWGRKWQAFWKLDRCRGRITLWKQSPDGEWNGKAPGRRTNSLLHATLQFWSVRSNSTCVFLLIIDMRLGIRLICRYNAIIWSNWGERLDNVIVVGNSFTRYESNMIKDDQRNSPSNCIFKLLPLWFEHLVMDGVPKGESPSLRFLFDAFHTTCVMRLKDGEKGANCGERPPEPECGGDVMRTVNSKLVEYVKEYENGKEEWSWLL